MRSILLLFVFLLSSISLVTAATWIGGTGHWEDPSNWSSNQVPGPGDQVFINNGDVTLNSTAFVNKVFISDGSYLTIEAGAALYAQSDTPGTLVHIDQAKLTVRGSLFCSGILTGNVTFGVSIANKGVANIMSTGNVYIGGLEATGIFIQSSGTLANYGQVTVEELTEYAIRNTGLLLNRGQMNIQDIDFNNALENGSNGHWLNYGELNIDQVSGNGFFNAGRLVNTEDIHINDCAAIGINTSGRFYNYSYGEIQIEADIGPGFFCWDSAETYNYGTINILTGGINAGVSNYGIFFNYHNGQVHTNDQSGGSGVSNNTSGEWYNYGSIIVFSSASPNNGLFNFGDMTNYSSGSIEVDGDYGTAVNNGGQFSNYGNLQSTSLSGVSLKIGGQFTNHPGALVTLNRPTPNPLNHAALFIGSSGLLTNNGGQITSTISNSTNAGLDNQGELFNQNCGVLHLEGKINNENNANFTNNAWLHSDHQGQHINNGMIQNNGVIEDLHGAFQGVSLTNDGLIVGPLTAPTYAPSLVQNVFDLDPGASIEIDDLWVEDCDGNGEKKGYYDQNNNELEIFEYTGGLTTFRFNVTFDGCTRCIRMEVPGGVQYPPSPFAAHPNATVPTQQLRISPNPSAGFVQVAFPDQLLDHSLEWRVYNLQGQQLAAGQWVEATPASLQFDQLPNGTYLLRVSAAGQLIGTERLVIQR